jgi:hypothetical protein
MSLINDALRRASQAEKDRPRSAPTPMGMEPVPAAQGSRLTAVLTVAVLVALLLAGWFFWQWWNARNNPARTVAAVNVAAQATHQIVPSPVVTPRPAPVVATAPANPAPAPVVATAAPVSAPPIVAPPVVVPPTAPPPAPPIAIKQPLVAWPSDLTLTAVFQSKTNPRALINGSLYGIGDIVEGVVLRKIDKEEVTIEMSGQTKILMMGGQ